MDLDARTTSITRLVATEPLGSTRHTASSSLPATTQSAARSNARRCGFPECVKTAKPGGLCISHGGGKKCSVQGCTTSVVSRGFCVAHGGGKRCQREQCTKSAQTGGFCWIHGGGKKCGHDGCTKRAQSGGACISHGGGKRCRIDGCNKVVQYEGLCVGHGGYRKCLSMNCAKKALPNGYCHGHGGNAMCHYGDCAKKAVHGGFCGQHRNCGSPQQVALSRSNSVSDSPSVNRPSLHTGPTISPMPLGTNYQQPARDWSRAIAEAKIDRYIPHQRDNGCDIPSLQNQRTRSPPRARLPTVVELQRSQPWEWSTSAQKALPSAAALFTERIAPLLCAVASLDASFPIKRDIVRESPRESAGVFCTHLACRRFAKVDGLCLTHGHLHHSHRRPNSVQPYAAQRHRRDYLRTDQP